MRRALPRNVVVLGVVSLLNDASSEAILPLLPLFVVVELGGGALAVAWIEGLAEAATSLLKLAGGWWSDRSRRRKPLVLGGYALSALLRPLFALVGSVGQLLAVRMAERVGKGLRTSPRDALIAAAVEPSRRAAAFGFHRGMDHLGAIVGPLLAAAWLAWRADDLRGLFLVMSLPAVGSLLVLLFFLREPVAAAAPARPAGTAPPGGGLWRLLLPLGLFTLGNASDVFLLLKAHELIGEMYALPLLWVGLHVTKAAASWPGGWLADRIGRRRVLAVGWSYYAALWACFAFAGDAPTVVALFVAYGLYHGLSEGAEKALVAELVPARRWGVGFGAYHVVVGLLTLAANLLFGTLWEAYSSREAFLAGAALALLAVAALALVRPRPLRA